VKRFSFVTIALIAASVIVAFITSFGEGYEPLKLLLIATPGTVGLKEIEGGEFWRLLTPVFVHFGMTHLLFNMLGLWDFGRMIEARRGSRFLVGFVLGLGITSNLISYLAYGPLFGGMSGVLYGLLAYMVTRNRRGGEAAGYALSPGEIVIPVIWYFACWTGVLGTVANWGHTAGLIGGLAWGLAETPVMRAARGWRQRVDVKGRLPGALFIATCCLLCAVMLVALYARLAQGTRSLSQDDATSDQLCASQDAAKPDQRISALTARLDDDNTNGSARARLLVERGDAHRATRHFDLAIEDYDKAIKVHDPDNAAAFAGRGIAKRYAGKGQEGVSDIHRAKEMDANIADTYPILRYLDMLDAALSGASGSNTPAGRVAQRRMALQILRAMPRETPRDGCLPKRMITFRTNAAGVSIPDQLRATYPADLTIILQHQYRDLVVTEQSIEVAVSFNRQWQRLAIPAEALTAFWDVTAGFYMSLSAPSQRD